MSIREISRRTGLARNTVKKYLRSDETEPTYARRVSSSKLDPYAEKLATWLGIEATKSRKQRRNLKQIYTSEYHYLFKMIYEASKLEQGQGLEEHYGLPNMARRMLESYLAYRVPGRSGDLRGKLGEIEGDDATKARVLRFLHTYSHGDVVAQPDHDPTILLETPAVLRDLLELLRRDDQRHFDQMVELAVRV